MSASVSVDDFGSEGTATENITAAPLDDQLAAADLVPGVEDITVIDDGIELVDDAPAVDTATETPIADASTATVGDDVLDGFQDPIMPFVIVGILSLIAIVVFAAMLAL